MDILVLSREFPPYVLGGISYHLCNLYNEIVDEGHNVTVLAGKCPQSYNELSDRVSSQINVEPVEFGYRKGYSVLYPIALRYNLRNIDIQKFDIAVSHTPLPYRIPHLNLVTKYHDCTAETRPYLRQNLSSIDKIGESILHPVRSYIEQKSLETTDYAIFNSYVNHQGWSDNYRVESEYSVIHNGVDVEKFRDVSDEDCEYILFVGSSTQKGLDRILNYADHQHRHVHIVGTEDVKHDNITAHGRVSQERLAELYSEAAATVHPAHFESFGNVVLESLACGTPVVTTNQCGASEIVTESSGAITNNIRSGIEKAVTLNSEDCRTVALEYQWETVAQRTIDILYSLME